MQNALITFFRNPQYDDAYKTYRAESLHILLLGNLVVQLILVLAIFLGLLQGIPQTNFIAGIGIVLLIATIFITLENKENFARAANLFVFALWISVMAIALVTGGPASPFLILLSSVIATAALVLSLPQIITCVVASLSIILILNIPPIANSIPGTQIPSNVLAGIYILNIIILGLLGARYIGSTNNLSTTLLFANEKNDVLNEELDDTRQALGLKSSTNMWRENTIRAISFIHSLTNKGLSEDQLLNEIVIGIANILDIAHNAIFLLDDTGNNAHLRASNSVSFQQLLQGEGYRLPVRQSTIKAKTPESGLPEIDFKVGDTSYQITRPVPASNVITEHNVPLVTGNKLIGLLNLQSTTELPEDLTWNGLMQTLAAQVAIVIYNNQIQQNILAFENQLRTITGQRISDAWQKIGTGGVLRYRFDQIRILPKGEKLPEEVISTIQAGRSASYHTSRDTYALAAPIQLSGQVLGVIGYELEKDRQSVFPEEITVLETVASQLSIALENARLFAETQQRAQSEQLIASVSNRIRESLDLDTVLRSAAKEIQQALNVDLAEIHLGLAEQDNEFPTLSGNGS